MKSYVPLNTEISNQSDRGEQHRDILKKDRRKVKEGFPKTEPFSSNEEVEHYLGQDEITCLLCGKAYKCLAAHLAKIHHMSSDDYKLRFSIPLYRGLTSTVYSQKLKDVRALDSAETRAKRTATITSKVVRDKLREAKPRNSGAHTRAAKSNISRFVVKGKKLGSKYTKESVLAVIAEMEATSTPLEYLFKKYGFGRTSFTRFVRENPDINARYTEVSQKIWFNPEVRSAIVKAGKARVKSK